jgi:hypothetical protein
MALIAVAADKGAPGVTTTAVALAALWPRRVLLAETDPAGGDLIYRSVGGNGRPLDPGTGVLSLAATARRGIAAEQLWDHSQRLSGGLDVIVGLTSADQAAGVAGQWSALGRAFAELAQSPHQEAAADVIADCGRLGADSPTLAMLPQAALLLLVTRVQPENLAHVRERAVALSNKLHGQQRGAAQLGKPQIGLLLVADPQQGGRIAGQVNEMMAATHAGARIVGLVAEDPAGAEQLAGRRRGRVDKSLLIRSARKVVADLHQNFRGELNPTGTGSSQTGQHPVLPQQQAAAASVPPQYTTGPEPAPAPGGPWRQPGPPQPAQPQPVQPQSGQHPAQPGYGGTQPGYGGHQPGQAPSGYGYPQPGQRHQPGAPGAVL